MQIVAFWDEMQRSVRASLTHERHTAKHLISLSTFMDDKADPVNTAFGSVLSGCLGCGMLLCVFL